MPPLPPPLPASPVPLRSTPAPRFVPERPQLVQLPTRPSLYKFLCELFASATELENFAALYFPNLARQFGAGMTFDQLARLLLADRGSHRVARPELLAALRQHAPEQAARCESLLQPEPDPGPTG